MSTANPIKKLKKVKKTSWWRSHRIKTLRAVAPLSLPFFVLLNPLAPYGGFAFSLLDAAGILLVFTGVLGRFWCTVYIGGRKARLVFQDGPYSICRHPLYLFSTLATIGLGLMLGSVIMALLIGTVVYTVLWNTAKAEEAMLRAEYGSDYDDYAARVPRIIPNLSLWKSEPLVTANISYLKTNFQDALVFLSFIPLSRLIVWLREGFDLGMIPIF